MADKTLQATIKLRDEMTKNLSNINKSLGDFQQEISIASDYLSDTESCMISTGQEANNLRDNINNADEGFKSFTSTINGMALQEVGSRISELGDKVLRFTAQMIETSSELNSEIAQQEFIYSNLDSTVQSAIDSGSEYARTLGMTEQQYKNIATGIDSYYKNMGLANNEIAKMSSETMILASDMAAMIEVPVEEAARDFKSAMMGNYEALDKYNINISAACLENSKYVKSLGKSWNQLSDNEKLMAVYNEAMRQSSDYTGLGAQEATEFAAQYKLLKEDVQEAAYALGNQLLPILAPMLQSIGQVVRAVGQWAKEHPKLAQAIMIAIAAIGLVLGVGGRLVTFLGIAAMAMGAVSAAGGIMALAFSPITLTILAVIAVFTALIAIGVALCANWDTICAKTSELKDWVINKFNELKDNANEAMENFKNGVVEKFNDTVETIKNAWQSVIDFTSHPITSTINVVKNIVGGGDTDGSHAFGLSRVPYNGYVARLHADEKVLTASEARRYNQSNGSSGVTIAKIADTVIIREEADINKIANEFARKLKSAQLTQA